MEKQQKIDRIPQEYGSRRAQITIKRDKSYETGDIPAQLKDF